MTKTAVGTADAGAFETALHTFAKMVINDELKFIMADEMEAISESKVSARVISNIIPNECMTKE